MTGPRNRPDWEEAQRRRRAIRRAMLDYAERHPLQSIPVKAIRQALPWLTITDGRIRAHMRQIRLDAGQYAGDEAATPPLYSAPPAVGK